MVDCTECKKSWRCIFPCAEYKESEDFIKEVCGMKGEEKGQKWDKGNQGWFAMPLEVLEPLADAFNAGVIKGYGRFNCLQPFDDSSQRFYDGIMRHNRASQIDPLAIDLELKEKYGVEVYHLAQIAFNSLMRLHHALKERAGTPCLPKDINNNIHWKDLPLPCPQCAKPICVCTDKKEYLK